MRHRILAGITALLMVAGLNLALATPAQASFDWCHGVSVACFAEHNDGNGIRWGPRSFPYGVCVNVPSNLDRKISSLWNKYGWDSSSPPLPITGYQSRCGERADALYTWGPSAYVQYVGWLNNDRMRSVCLGPRSSGYCP